MPGTTSAETGVEALAPKTEISTLPNGVRVVTESAHGMGCNMAIFLNVGSRSERQEFHGCSHFYQHLAFKATTQRSFFMFSREVEKIGGHVAAGASRDCITFAGECLLPNAPKLFELIAESALKPSLESQDIDIARNLVMADIENSNNAKQGGAKVLDLLHDVAFRGQTLGAPLLCDPSMAPHINGETIQKFMSSTLCPSGIVVSAVGVPHQEMVKIAEQVLGKLKKNAIAKPIAKAEYDGGELRVPTAAAHHGDGADVHLALGFKGVACTDNELLAAAVLQTLLGGGDSFSAGGPGKGLTSRIFVNVLSTSVKHTFPGICKMIFTFSTGPNIFLARLFIVSRVVHAMLAFCRSHDPFSMLLRCSTTHESLHHVSKA